ncbi:uncharacterized protein LOC111927006 [Cyanistes caeruleus]|uniref:uncharacterized protein LOC111927006 n=1 Tax=Cyanistes caeruleus TaxID=156563 RepID=UPI000CDA69BA|nr:uncharacterized protein LOC111927006 [Cyanistes caeruleus]
MAGARRLPPPAALRRRRRPSASRPRHGRAAAGVAKQELCENLLQKGQLGSCFDPAVTWNKHVGDKSSVIIIYEDLKGNLASGVKQIAAFFGFSPTAEQLQAIAGRHTFQPASVKAQETHGAVGLILFHKDSYWNNFCRCGEMLWSLGFCAPRSLQNQAPLHPTSALLPPEAVPGIVSWVPELLRCYSSFMVTLERQKELEKKHIECLLSGLHIDMNKLARWRNQTCVSQGGTEVPSCGLL